MVLPSSRGQVLPKDGSWFDIGSGNGLPGMVWACLNPKIKFFLVEGSQKKAAFLRQTALTLGLGQVEVIPHRLESIPEGVLLKTFPKKASAVSRGTASPPTIVRLFLESPIPFQAWYVFSSARTHDELLTLGGKFGMEVQAIPYQKDLEDPKDRGILTKLVQSKK